MGSRRAGSSVVVQPFIVRKVVPLLTQVRPVDLEEVSGAVGRDGRILECKDERFLEEFRER